jgi:uncharacterized protein YgiM (DUF1202 family)
MSGMLRLTPLQATAIVSFAALYAPVIAWAQQSQNQPASAASAGIPADVVDKLASDLAKLQVGIQATQQLAASSPVQNQILVTSDAANVLSGATPSASKEFVAKKGEKLFVLDRANDYYAVATDNGRTGWIMAADVKPETNAYNTAFWQTWNPSTTTAAPAVQNGPPQDSGVAARIFKSLTEQAVQFRDSYKDNKYMFVSGFTVHVGIPPSVDLAFTFR